MEMQFMEHVANFGLSYGTVEEFAFRAEQFNNVHKEIEDINAANILAGKSLRLAHNFLSSWTFAEKKRLNGYKDIGAFIQEYTVLPETNSTEVNWVTAGAVTAVKDQGQCGSCWSFSTTGSLEGSYQIGGNPLTSFSEQQLVACDKPLNHGCHGGSMALAFKYIKKHALATEDSYPYTAGAGVRGSCLDFSGMDQPVKASGFHMVLPADEKALLSAAALGPVSVALEADQASFQNYTSGVITEGCGVKLDHGVLIAGFGTLDGEDYWLVKNSWGPSWGDHGYLRIGRSSGAGVCGINMQAVYPEAIHV